jgi:hypothetical protein
MSQIDLSKLYTFISNSNQTFENISKFFNTEFNAENKNKAITVIIILLKDNLLNINQRIICYYILYDTSQKEKMETNPFLFIILEKLKNSKDKIEQNFLLDFLYKKINYLGKTINEYLNKKPKEMKINITQIQMQWDKYYKELLKQKNININSDGKIRPFVYDVNNVNIMDINNSFKKFNALDNVNSENKNHLNYFKSGYMSFRPNNINFLSSEPIFLLPNLNHKFIWEKE